MKFTFLLFFSLSFGVGICQNDLKLDSTFHRSDVNGFFAGGLEYYRMPQTQLRPIEFSAVASNIGLNDITNCYLSLEIKYAGATIFTEHSDSVFMPSMSQDSLFVNVSIDLSGQPLGIYTFIYSIISDSTETNSLNNFDSVFFEITEYKLTRHNSIVIDSSANFYHDSLNYEGIGYAFQVAEDACLSNISAWISIDSANVYWPIYATLWKLDTVSNEFELLDISPQVLTLFSHLGNSIQIPFDPLSGELVAGNIYVINVHSEEYPVSFYLCQQTIDSTIFYSYHAPVPGGSPNETFGIIDGFMPMIDIELGNSTNCQLGSDKHEIDFFRVHPNPASEIIWLNFTISEPQEVLIYFSDINGKIVYELDLGKFEVGVHVVELHTSNFANGMYFLNMVIDGQLKTKKISIDR